MGGGAPRRKVLIALASTGPEPRVDVGADHGRVAEAIGGFATEIQTDHPRRAGIQWVVMDGLKGLRHVGTAVIAGMGARTIARILQEAPPIEQAVLHAQDDPPALRRWLAGHGWRITHEALAPEARRFAEIIVAVRGREQATGLELEYGPKLLHGDDPLLRDHLAQLGGHLRRLVAQTAPSPAAHAAHLERARFIEGVLARVDGRGAT